MIQEKPYYALQTSKDRWPQTQLVRSQSTDMQADLHCSTRPITVPLHDTPDH